MLHRRRSAEGPPSSLDACRRRNAYLVAKPVAAFRKDLHPHVGEFVWTQQHNYFGWHSLLCKEPGSAGTSPYAAASRAADVSGLPPTYISVGGLELFLEESMTYADRLSRAGVLVEFHMCPRTYHGFYRATNARVTPQAERDTREAGRARAPYGDVFGRSLEALA